MNQEERNDLWEIMGQARPTQVSAFFSRNVLRAIRNEQLAPKGIAGWLLRRWPILAAAACVIAIAGTALWPTPEPVTSVDVLAKHVSASPDYAVIGNLDELLAAEESSAWLNYSVE